MEWRESQLVELKRVRNVFLLVVASDHRRLLRSDSGRVHSTSFQSLRHSWQHRAALACGVSQHIVRNVKEAPGDASVLQEEHSQSPQYDLQKAKRAYFCPTSTCGVKILAGHRADSTLELMDERRFTQTAVRNSNEILRPTEVWSSTGPVGHWLLLAQDKD